MIGIDLVRIERITTLMDRYGDKALERFLHPSEIELVKHPRTAAGFWAAKEACSKALGCGIGGECGFKDITISKSQKGSPQLTLNPKVSHHFSVTKTSLSITHDGEYAIAAVMLQ